MMAGPGYICWVVGLLFIGCSLADSFETRHIESGLVDHRTRDILNEKRPLCLWNPAFGLCAADVVGNVPNKRIKEESERIQACAQFPTPETCAQQVKCEWNGVACTVDVEVVNEECLVFEWITVTRSLQCPLLPTEEKCTLIPGCKWDGGVCKEDSKAVEKAAASNETVGKSFKQFQECQATNVQNCKEPCSPLGQICTFASFFDASNFYRPDATSPFCIFQSMLLECAKRGPEACEKDGDCRLVPGSCVMTDEAIVRITYAEKPKRQKKINNALEKCPDFKDEKQCVEFR